MRGLILALFFALSGCSGFVGSPHGYAGVASWQQTGIFIGNPQTGTGVSLGSMSAKIAILPTLDGNGHAIDPVALQACFSTEAGTGASIITDLATANAAKGC